MLQALKQLYLTGINSQAAEHGADTETMIGSNAPTRIKRDPRCLSLTRCTLGNMN